MTLLPPDFLDTVVAIGIGDNAGFRQWIGTGFIFGYLVDEQIEDGKKAYQLWLITNKHVFAGQKNIFLKFNSLQDLNSKDYEIPLMFKNGRSKWVGHPSDVVDIAALFLNPGFLRGEERLFYFFKSDQDVFTKDKMIDSKISEGDNIFVLGFPMGLVDEDRQYVICRGGHIARIRDYLEDHSKDFLIDALIFPGNSGGPVILRPSIVSVGDIKPVNQAVLLGIVKQSILYNDVAISLQTRRQRILFQENSGLAIVEPVSFIMETVEIASKRFKNRVNRAKRQAKTKL